MKKRVLAVILGAVMTMSLAACGSSDAGKTSSFSPSKNPSRQLSREPCSANWEIPIV